VYLYRYTCSAIFTATCARARVGGGGGRWGDRGGGEEGGGKEREPPGHPVSWVCERHEALYHAAAAVAAAAAASDDGDADIRHDAFRGSSGPIFHAPPPSP